VSIAKPKTDKDYEARSDAHTLKEAAAIHADPARSGAAVKALEQIEKEAQGALDAIKNAKPLAEKMYPSMKKDTDKDGK
jgi:hypothetical protein